MGSGKDLLEKNLRRSCLRGMLMMKDEEEGAHCAVMRCACQLSAVNVPDSVQSVHAGLELLCAGAALAVHEPNCFASIPVCDMSHA